MKLKIEVFLVSSQLYHRTKSCQNASIWTSPSNFNCTDFLQHLFRRDMESIRTATTWNLAIEKRKKRSSHLLGEFIQIEYATQQSRLVRVWSEKAQARHKYNGTKIFIRLHLNFHLNIKKIFQLSDLGFLTTIFPRIVSAETILF